MNIVYLSVYIDLFWFPSLALFSFQHTEYIFCYIYGYAFYFLEKLNEL